MKPDTRLSVFLAFITVLVIVSVYPLPVKAEKVIRAGVLQGTAPFCFVDDRSDGTKLRGMSVDMMELVGKLLKSRIIYIRAQNLNHRWEMLKNGEIDAIVFSGTSEKHPKDIKYLPVGISIRRRIYVHKDCMTVVCAKDLKNKRVGILQGGSYALYPELGEAVAFSCVPEGLKSLHQGEIEAMIAPSELNAEYLIQKNKWTNIRRVGMVLDRQPLNMAIKAENATLFNELTMGIERLRQSGSLDAIEEKWKGVAYQENIWSKYGRFIFLGIGLAGFGLFVVLFWNHRLKTEIRKVTLNLQISEKKLRALIESSPDMIFVINSEGMVVNANKKARIQILGDGIDLDIPKQGSDLIQFAIERDKSRFKAFIGKALAAGQGSDEFSFYDRTGSIRELSMAAALITGDYPESDATTCLFARDVTERNCIERDLVQADRMAIIGQMAAGVAHEINNPLGIVRANLELIVSRGWFSEEARDFVDSIRRNTERAGKITQNLLAVGKPATTSVTAVNLRELLDQTLTMLKPQLKRVSIKRQDSGVAPVVLGDSSLLLQVLVNLFLNAINAMDGQVEPAITVICCSSPKEAAARIEVLDNGPGIDKHLLMKIFEPFYSNTKKEGFGIGLFISQRIIDRYDGIIFAESEREKGAQMVIELPLMTSPDEDRIES